MSRFLQLHTLTSYPATLLNRDDVGFAKRVTFGGSERVRISSQCLKRHWRTSDDDNALRHTPLDDGTAPMSIRSRRTFEAHLYRPLVEDGTPEEVAHALTEEILGRILPEGKAKQTKAAAQDAEAEGNGESSLRTQQVTVLGEPEMRYLLSIAREVAAEVASAKEAKKALQQRFKGDFKKNAQALAHGAGLDAALFGRMVTGDVLARCDAAIHVAHAFTVHPGFFETDYFSAVDDLQSREETGSGHINNSELTTGLFYGYLVVDVPLLVSNLEGCPRAEWRQADPSLAGEVVRRMVHLVTTVSPGAKLGATAPYAPALMVLGESGTRQPRTLANAFLDPVSARGGLLGQSYRALARHLGELDRMYGPGEERRIAGCDLTDDLLERVGSSATDVPGVAGWMADQIGEAS